MLLVRRDRTFKIYIIIGLQRSIGQIKGEQRIIKLLKVHAHLIIDQFYLLISVEGVWSILEGSDSLLANFGTSTYMTCKPHPQKTPKKEEER